MIFELLLGGAIFADIYEASMEDFYDEMDDLRDEISYLKEEIEELKTFN